MRNYLYLTLGSLLLAVNLNLFLAPSQIARGGVSGIAIIAHRFTNWPIGLMMLILNIPLLAIGFRALGRFRFLARTLYVVILYNLGADVLARWLPAAGLTQDLLLNALYGGVLGGLGAGLPGVGRAGARHVAARVGEVAHGSGDDGRIEAATLAWVLGRLGAGQAAGDAAQAGLASGVAADQTADERRVLGQVAFVGGLEAPVNGIGLSFPTGLARRDVGRVEALVMDLGLEPGVFGLERF
ncbi:MAG: YitT family protein [Chloroflexi bacterium]|nr:YitT family protein [Chloroflexota bacterium]